MPHTLGPWVAQRDDMTTSQPYSIYSTLESTSDGKQYMDDPVAQYVQDRDAHLIAAAPDLLAALRAINEWCGTDDGAHALPFEPPWAAKMYAAIAKATGGKV